MINKYGIQIEIGYTPHVNEHQYHYRVFTTKEDWSGIAKTLEEAWQLAQWRYSVILLGTGHDFPPNEK